MSARVLVVDDTVPNVKLLAAKLTREYYDVLTACDGPEALQKVAQESPDIVLLDVMMPGMDGFEVCEKIRANPATMHIPVIMVTALSEVSDRVRGLQAGADDFLSKPINDFALFARLRSLVRLKMMMDEWRLRESTSGQFGLDGANITILSESIAHANILVVDDSRIDGPRIEKYLDDDKHAVQIVESGTSALDLANLKDFDLIICNLDLGSEDALRLCALLRAHEKTRQTPILLLAGEEDQERIAKALDMGVNDYLLRPLDKNELLARTRTQIRRRRYQERLRNNYEQSLTLALTDALTGTFNRRYVNVHLPRLLERNAETGKPVSVFTFDIDHFKHVNDTWGHAVGDEVLTEIGARATRNLRNFDLVARMGGEEFLVVMPDTSLDVALSIAERLRLRIAEDMFTVSDPVGQIPITISIGVAECVAGDTSDTLQKRADDALYTAKRTGRNRVIAAGQEVETFERPAAL